MRQLTHKLRRHAIDSKSKSQKDLNKCNHKSKRLAVDRAATYENLKGVIDNFDLYLSNEELKAIIEKIGAIEKLPDVLNILIENGPLHYTVSNFLTEHLNSLSLKSRLQLKKYDKLVNQLLEPPIGLSLAQEVEAEIINYTQAQKFKLRAQCIKPFGVKRVGEILNNLAENTSENKNYFTKKLIEFKINAGLYEEAQFNLSKIEAKDTEELEVYKQLKEITISLKKQKKSIADLNNKELHYLEKLADSKTHPGIQARNILLHYYDSTYVVTPPKMEEEIDLREPLNDREFNLNNTVNVIQPNPATNSIQLNLLPYFNQLGDLSLNIYNTNGQLVKQIEDYNNGIATYNVNDLVEGVYVVEISSESNKIQLKNKLIIVR